MKINRSYTTSLLLLLALSGSMAQEVTVVTLEGASQMALENSRLLKIKEYQVSEKRAKVSEDRVKFFPVATLNSTYQYNSELAKLTIPKGMFGAIAGNALPGKDEVFNLSEHTSFNAGAVIYQPITQLGKISSGVSISKRDAEIADKEFLKAKMQIRQAVEKLYFGILIAQKQHLESELKVAFLDHKMANVESAYGAGKALEMNRLGMMASLADEEQTMLKLDIQLENYKNDFQILTGLKNNAFSLEGIVVELTELGATDIDSTVLVQNIDIQVASLVQEKAKYGVRAARYSFLPDFGVMAGYTYQMGSNLYPNNNPFVGATLKWNLTDLVSNHYLTGQRKLMHLQATENRLNVEDNTIKDLQKAERNIRQSIKLIQVAQKVVIYRTQEVELQQNKENAGVILESDLFSSKASLAKAESDLLAAQLSYRLAVSDKKILLGAY